MEVLKVKRGRIKASLTRIATFAESINDSTELEALTVRLDKLKESWDEFNQVQNDIIEIRGEDITENERESDQFETKYFYTHSLISKQINALKVTNSPNLEETNDAYNRLLTNQSAFFERLSSTHVFSNNINNANNSIGNSKLPKIRIPPFNGDYREWTSFHDLFISAIHNNDNLDAAQKFHYLKGLLQDEAATLLRHIPVSENNYTQAWERLKRRYDKKSYIVNSFIKTFLSLPSSSQPSTTMLRKLFDGADEVIRGLKALGAEAEKRDPWLIHILLNKLDNDTKQAWAEKTVAVDYPSLTSFIEFLENRVQALETCNTTSKISTSCTKVTNTLKGHTAVSPNCPLCKNNHCLYQCSKFIEMDVGSRREFVNKNSICFNCLRPGHKFSLCRSTNSCHQCRKRHHTLVHPSSTTIMHQTSSRHSHHPDQAKELKSNLSRANTIEIENANSFIAHHSCYQTLLPTAIVNIYDENNHIHSARLLLDTGSQVSFVTESLVQKLRLKRKNARIPVTGLSVNAVGNTRGLVSLCLKSRYNPTTINIKAYILKRLTSQLPNTSLNTSELHNINNLPLADPLYHQPSEIDIIIGADSCFEIFQEGYIPASSDTPAAQLTIFGWVVVGKLAMNQIPNSMNELFVSSSSTHCKLEPVLEISSKTEITDVYEQNATVVKERPYSCDECGKSFLLKHHLTTHARVHTGERSHVCVYCSKTFAHKHCLNTHLLLHSTDHPYQCSECKKSFTLKHHLLTHSRFHRSLNPFVCPDCGATFPRRFHLVNHGRIHGKVPHSCTVSGKEFLQKRTLVSHTRIHTGDQPYPCTGCGDGFQTKAELNQHIHILHGGINPNSLNTTIVSSNATIKATSSVLSTAKKKPNFRDDPTGYLNHQSAILHNSIQNLVQSPDLNDSISKGTSSSILASRKSIKIEQENQNNQIKHDPTAVMTTQRSENFGRVSRTITSGQINKSSTKVHRSQHQRQQSQIMRNVPSKQQQVSIEGSSVVVQQQQYHCEDQQSSQSQLWSYSCWSTDDH